MARRLNYPLLIARAIAARVDLRQDLSAALKKRDKPRIRRLIREIRVAREALYDLWLFHRSMWMATYKPFGWEVIEHRYGGLLARLDTLSDRLNDYLAGRLEAIPELTTDLQDPWAKLPYAGVSSRHDRVKTPSCIK
jgi:hypothetical protein